MRSRHSTPEPFSARCLGLIVLRFLSNGEGVCHTPYLRSRYRGELFLASRQCSSPEVVKETDLLMVRVCTPSTQIDHVLD